VTDIGNDGMMDDGRREWAIRDGRCSVLFWHSVSFLLPSIFNMFYTLVELNIVHILMLGIGSSCPTTFL